MDIAITIKSRAFFMKRVKIKQSFAGYWRISFNRITTGSFPK